jgi:hypothetical protein
VYDIYLERSAEHDLKKLPKDLFQKIISHIKDMAINPRPPGSRKIKSSKMIGVLGSEITGSSMKVMKRQKL